MSTPAEVEQFKRIFNELDADHLHLVGELYADKVEFRDPIHAVDGVGNLRTYFANLYDGVKSCQFTFESELAGEGEAMLSWTMHMEHGRFRKGETVHVPGMSHIRYADGKVTYHRDYFDMGRLIYERVPLLGAVVRKIKSRL